MITCTSEMSGRASRGIWRIDQIPASVSRSTPVKTRKRLCAHHSMIREITLHTSRGIHGSRLPSAWRWRNKCARGSLQLRLGIDQEVCRSNNLFLSFQAFGDYDLITHLRPELDRARLNAAFAAMDEHQVLCSRMKSCAGRDYQLSSHRQLRANIHVHSGP